MIRLSNRGRHAVQAEFDLALHARARLRNSGASAGDQPAQVRDVAGAPAHPGPF